MIKQTLEYTIYENQDGTMDVYKKIDGGDFRKLVSTLEESMDLTKKHAEWMDILHLANKSPALQEAIERVIVLYELQVKDEDRSLMWHPV